MTAALELRGVVGHSSLGTVGHSRPLNFSLHSGEVGLVLGGKETSSLLRLIMGLGVIEQGELHLHGRLVLDGSAKASDAQILRQAIGFGFRDKGLLSNLTLKDNVDLPAKYHGRYKPGVPAGSLSEQALHELGVDRSVWDLRPSRISGELRKKVLLARAIVLSPGILVLDDPSAMAASPFIPELLRWIQRQKSQGTAILIGTNDYPFGLAIADWVLHPESRSPVANYDDFIDATWIQSAALLAGKVGCP